MKAKRERRDDPMDLMMQGRIPEAAEEYLKLYVKSAKTGDHFLGPIALTQLHYCVAGMTPGVLPENATKHVEVMARERLREEGVEIVEENVRLDLSLAENTVLGEKEYADEHNSQVV